MGAVDFLDTGLFGGLFGFKVWRGCFKAFGSDDYTGLVGGDFGVFVLVADGFLVVLASVAGVFGE